MPDNKIQLILHLLSRGFPEGKRHLDSIRTGASNLKRGVGELNRTFSSLKTLMIGSAIAAPFMYAVKQAVSFNKSLETSRLGIAAILTSMAQITDEHGRILEGQEKFNAAGMIAVRAQKELLSIGMNTAAEYVELVEVFQGILAPALSAKMTLAETLEITGLLTNAVKALGLATNQIKQEARDLIQGGIQPASSSLAVALRINDAMVKKWREQGTVAQELKQRLQGFVYASNQFQDSWEGIWSNFKDIVQMALGRGMESIFSTLKRELKAITSSLVNVEHDASGAISKIEIKPIVLWRLRQVGALLDVIILSLKSIGTLFVWAFKYVPPLSWMTEGVKYVALEKARQTIEQNVPGVQIPRMAYPDIEELLKKGLSPEEIGQAISAGVIKVKEGKFTGRPVLGGLGMVGKISNTTEYDQAALDKWRVEQARRAEGTNFGVGSNPQPDPEEELKKRQKATEQLQEQIDKLRLTEEQLVEKEAERLINVEKLSPKLVEQWKTLELARIETEKQKAISEWQLDSQEKEIQEAQDRLEYTKQTQEAEDELAKRREAIAVEKGEMSAVEAVNAEYERKRKILELEKQILEVRLQSMSQADPNFMPLYRRKKSIQSSLDRLPGEKDVAVDEANIAAERDAFETTKNFASGYHLFREQQLNQLANKLRAAGINEVDIQRWVTQEKKQYAIEDAQFQLEQATNVGEALGAKYRLMVLQSKSYAEQTADAIEGAFTDVKGAISDLLMDSTNGFKNWASIVSRLVDSVLKRLIDLQLNKIFGQTSEGGGFFGLFKNLLGLGSTFGGVNSNAFSYAQSEYLGGLLHTGRGPGDAPRLFRLVPSSVFDNARRLHGGIGLGEEAAIIRRDESVLTPGQMRALGLMTAGASSGPVVTNYYYISALDTQSLEQALRKSGAVVKLAREDLEGNGALRNAIRRTR